MKNADARTKLPLIIFLSFVLLAVGCSSDKDSASEAASGQPAQQDSRKPNDVNWATGAPQVSAGDQSSAGDSTQPAAFESYEPPAAQAATADASASESQESAPVADDPATAARKKVEQLKVDETYIVKYIEKVEKRLETEQDPNFRAGYERGLAQARQNYEDNKKDLAAAQQELAAASKKQ